MNLHPYHDASGSLYPELDTREVSVDVMVHYLGLSRITIWKRAGRGDYGNSVPTGAWFGAPKGNKRKCWTFRPAVLWRVKQWGRFNQVGFRPLDLEGRVRIYHCDPTTTSQRHAEQGGTGQEMIPALTHALGGLMEAMSVIRLAMPRQTGESIPFTLEVVK